MAEPSLPRILELLNAVDPAVVDQGVELVVALEDPAIYEELLRNCRINVHGKILEANPLRQERAVLRLVAHAPESARLHESLRRATIRTLAAIPALLAGRFAHFPVLERLSLITSGETLPDDIGDLPTLRSLSVIGALTHLSSSLTRLTALESLHIAAPKLTALPDSLTALPTLRSLHLHCRALSALPDDLSPGLTNLHLDALPLTALPDRLAALTRLERLTLTNMPGLTVLPDGMAALADLTHLNISATGIPVLPPFLDRLPALQQVTLDDHLIHDAILALAGHGTWAGVDAAVAAMAMLADASPESLDALLRGGELLPGDRLIRGYRWVGALQAGLDHAWLSGLTLLPPDHPLTARLTRLDLSDGLEPNPRPGDLLATPRQVTAPAALIRLLLATPLAGPKIRELPGLQRLPVGLDRFERLERLDLSGNRIIELPGPLPERLKWLNLSGNPLLTFPSALLGLSRLRTLNLAKTTLTALPSTGWHACRLTELDLSGNALQDLPAGLNQARTLTALLVADNQLHTLPDLTRLTRLARLDLSDNRLSHLPDWLGTLPLVTLTADRNQICTLPDAQPGWKKMITLSLTDNGLLVLPEVETLVSLENLDLSDNPLRQIPEDLSPLHRLSRLNLRSCHLERLPESLWHLPALAWIDAADNPITELPWAVRTTPVLRHLDLSGCPLSISPMLRWMLQRRLGEGLVE